MYKKTRAKNINSTTVKDLWGIRVNLYRSFANSFNGSNAKKQKLKPVNKYQYEGFAITNQYNL